ncbi:unnamed protein product [Echinostoma caproni]|uniref:DUF4201 domain-containing protein n=1 Tax=Echinostoma caproni TaxID=27848 RepID=A0A3P8G255_9TREM|nr:unnamed protein product [Echinostoma caproni]
MKLEVMRENEIFETYLRETLPHLCKLLEAEQASATGRFTKRVRPASRIHISGHRETLTMRQKCEILESEVNRINQQIIKMKREFEEPIKNYKATAEALEKRKREIPELVASFKRNVVQGGYDARLGAVASETLLRYHEICMTHKETQINRFLVESCLMRIRTRQMRWIIRQREIWRAAFTPLELERMRLLHASSYRECDELKAEVVHQKWYLSRLLGKVHDYKDRNEGPMARSLRGWRRAGVPGGFRGRRGAGGNTVGPGLESGFLANSQWFTNPAIALDVILSSPQFGAKTPPPREDSE